MIVKQSRGISDARVALYASAVDAVVARARTVLGSTFTGGYFCVSDSAGFIVLLISSINSDHADAPKFERAAQEAAAGLARNPQFVSSSQGRSPSVRCPGGAIRLTDGNVLSFAGSEVDDNAAIVIAVACSAGDIDRESHAARLAGLNRTKRWKLFME